MINAQATLAQQDKEPVDVTVHQFLFDSGDMLQAVVVLPTGRLQTVPASQLVMKQS